MGSSPRNQSRKSSASPSSGAHHPSVASAPRPKPADMVHMIRTIVQGSPVDAPRSFLSVLLELFRGPTAPGSQMTMQDALASPTYRDLWTAELSVGDPAIPFELPLLHSHEDLLEAAGENVSIAKYLGGKPLALIFGSYT